MVLIGARWLRYARWSPPAFDHLLQELMVLDQQTFLWPWAYSMLEIRPFLLALAVLVVGLHRRLPARLVGRVDGRWHLTPLAVSLSFGAMVWLHAVFDLNTTLAVVCATSLLLAWVTARVGRALPRVVLVGAWCLFFAVSLRAARDPADRVAVATWGAFLAVTHLWVSALVGRAELGLLRVLTILPMNLLASLLPLVVPLHGGRLLGDGFAYSFCERPGSGTLYATIPGCGTPRSTYEECGDGRIVEYDLGSMRPVAEHRFFSPDLYGRLELLMCLPDEVHVAVQGLIHHGRDVIQGVLSFPVGDPRAFRLLSTGDGIGATMLYDELHDAVFYAGEFNNPLVRYDRRTKQFDDTAGQDLLRPWYQPVMLKAEGCSLALDPDSIDPERNRLYVAEFMQGRYAYAVDLTTLRVVHRYDVGGGGAMGLTVDRGRDRLIVSSLWGLEVFDLATDRLIARKRSGLGTRPAVVDAARNRLYVGSMVEGKIRILDRDTFETLAQIPIGFGSRYPHLSLDGRRFFASSARAHYYWDADVLGTH